jgi:hypothetical protein
MLGSQGSLPTETSLSLSFEDLLALPLAGSVQRPLFAALLHLLQRRAGPGQAQNLEQQLRHEILQADLQRCRQEALAGLWCEAFDRLAALGLPCRREGKQAALQALQLELVQQFWHSLVQLDTLTPETLPMETESHWAVQAVLIDLQSLGLERPSWLKDVDWHLTVRGLALHLGLDQEAQGVAAWRLEQRLLGLMIRLCHHDDPAPPWVQVHAESRLRLCIARLVAAGSPLEPSLVSILDRWVQVLRQLRTTGANSPGNEELMPLAILRHWQVIARFQIASQETRLGHG